MCEQRAANNAANLDKLCSWIHSQVPEMIRLETLLSSIPALAPESGGSGEMAKCDALDRVLKNLGFSLFDRYDAPDIRVPSGKRPNMVVTVPGCDDLSVQKSSGSGISEKVAPAGMSPRLWVVSHLDVVPPGELSLWKTDPWKVIEQDGKLFGRGVEDDQQGLVASVFAALAFLKTGIKPAYTVKLLFAADEEVGSEYGIQYLIREQELLQSTDFILIPDGGDPEGITIEVAEKNLMWLKFVTKGKQAHASCPDQGSNAHLAACDLALRVHALEESFDHRDPLFSPDRSTFQPTKKEANVPNVNTIPGEDIFYMDCRVLPFYSLDAVRTELVRIMKDIEEKYGVSVTCTEEHAVESRATAADAPVVQALSTAISAVYGLKPYPVGIGGGTVGAYLRNAGLDAVVWGRLHGTAHQPNEYCVIENLVGDACVMAAMMLGVAGH